MYNDAKTTVSEISEEDIFHYTKIDINSYPKENQEVEKKLVKMMLDVAKSFILSYTGVSNIDNIEEFSIVIYILVADMYENRTLYIDKNNLNITVKNILDMNSENYVA